MTYDKNIEELARIADGGAYPAIKPDDICTLPLIIPSINIIEKFDELTSNFREMMNNSLIQNEYLTNLRGTLLPKLISGELSWKIFRISPPIQKPHNAFCPVKSGAFW